MGKIVIIGTVFNLVKATEEDGVEEPSHWIEKDEAIVSDIYYGTNSYLEAKEVFDLLENQKAEV